MRLTVDHPWTEGPLRLAPGLVQVQSVRGSHLSLYTFGASLVGAAESDLSTGRLESDAPILWVNKSLYDNDLNPIDLVADEFQAWLSVLRARAEPDLVGFHRRLQRVSPFLLYLQALILAERILGSAPVDERSERYWRSHQVLLGALHAAQARPHAPNPLPDLELMLRP